MITDEEGVFEILFELNDEASKAINTVQLSLLPKRG